MLLFCLLMVSLCVGPILGQQQEQPYFIEKCPREEPVVNECLLQSGNNLVQFLRKGIPEIGILEVEPVIVDEIGIALGGGPDGYRAVFRNIQAYGVSNLTISHVRSDLDSYQFQFTIDIPRIRATAQYRSSGVLILVRASGAGDYWGEYNGVRAKIYLKGMPIVKKDGLHYLTIQQVKMDFNVKEIQMGVENIAHGNSVIKAALNLFINSNSQELLKEMKPALRSKLTAVIGQFMNRLLDKIPLEQWFY
ncbi:uncharacterized protein LOC129614053 [Condylostylus longicornis]|uniref:uncharacterized protein LOC129614053 n=1 Tax=Condylostylus longicornis TaxID=2530218 RepID=UPI00244DBCFA|nr:uncharacterized protein LOC129614053 [Condylostylus longicornis]